MSAQYLPEEWSRADVDSMQGGVLLDFGTNWCGYCQAARPLVEEACGRHPGVRHVMIEDGKGRPLGRSFGVKLWPTLIFLRDGREMFRMVRPQGLRPILDALENVDG